jgi:TATA-binding protein-associated factor Taf7
LQALKDGKIYINVHSLTVPAGLIRGNLHPAEEKEEEEEHKEEKGEDEGGEEEESSEGEEKEEEEPAKEEEEVRLLRLILYQGLACQPFEMSMLSMLRKRSLLLPKAWQAADDGDGGEEEEGDEEESSKGEEEEPAEEEEEVRQNLVAGLCLCIQYSACKLV